MPLSAQWAVHSLFPLLDSAARSDPAGPLALRLQLSDIFHRLIAQLPLLSLRSEPEALMDRMQRLLLDMMHAAVASPAAPQTSASSAISATENVPSPTLASSAHTIVHTSTLLALQRGEMRPLLQTVHALLNLHFHAPASSSPLGFGTLMIDLLESLASHVRESSSTDPHYVGIRSRAACLTSFVHDWTQQTDAPLSLLIAGSPGASQPPMSAPSSSSSASLTSSASAQPPPTPSSVATTFNPGMDIPSRSSVCVHGDSGGAYVFVYHTVQGTLTRIGTGRGNTIAGRVYAQRRDFFRGHRGWLAWYRGQLFFRSRAMLRALCIRLNPDTLEDVEVIDAAPPAPLSPSPTSTLLNIVGADLPPQDLADMFSDGQTLYFLSQPLALNPAVCAALGICSFAATGSNFVSQHWFVCRTCSGQEASNVGCCFACAKQCHRLHTLFVAKHSPSPFFCDCGADDLSASHPCRCCSTEVQQVQQQHLDRLLEREEYAALAALSSEQTSRGNLAAGAVVNAAVPVIDQNYLDRMDAAIGEAAQSVLAHFQTSTASSSTEGNAPIFEAKVSDIIDHSQRGVTLTLFVSSYAALPPTRRRVLDQFLTHFASSLAGASSSTLSSEVRLMFARLLVVFEEDAEEAAQLLLLLATLPIPPSATSTSSLPFSLESTSLLVASLDSSALDRRLANGICRLIDILCQPASNDWVPSSSLAAAAALAVSNAQQQRVQQEQQKKKSMAELYRNNLLLVYEPTTQARPSSSTFDEHVVHQAFAHVRTLTLPSDWSVETNMLYEEHLLRSLRLQVHAQAR